MVDGTYGLYCSSNDTHIYSIHIYIYICKDIGGGVVKNYGWVLGLRFELGF